MLSEVFWIALLSKIFNFLSKGTLINNWAVVEGSDSSVSGIDWWISGFLNQAQKNLDISAMLIFLNNFHKMVGRGIKWYEDIS